MDLLPPPPYSETDIYSNPPTSPSVRITPATSNADHASLPAPSRASSIDNSIIYTPPETPSGGSVHHDHDYASSTSAAAEAYFESRPAPRRANSTPSTHSIAITASTKPEDLPFPEPIDDFLAKGVEPHDWATFVNYLLPDYASGVNNEVADKKLKAELIDERMQRLTLGQHDRSRTDLDQVKAQLEPLRSTSSQNADWQGNVRATIDMWNEGFFLPRGVKIRLVDSELVPEQEERVESNRMPGAWIPYDHELPGGMPASARGPKRGWSFGGIRADSRGFKMGPIEADDRGFRMGNMLVADHKGFRFGKDRFVADENGLTIGGRSFGRRPSHDNEDRSNKREDHSNRRVDYCGHSRGRDRKHVHRGRNRSHSHGRNRRRRVRDSSTSSSSSSSSSSSADSISSLGSLPAYDDLQDQQLPTAKQSLQDWLNHPDQPITREMVQNLKVDLDLSKKNSSVKYQEDMKALRREVRDLMREFKDRKRAQKILQRQQRRERRADRRALKRERRTARREERKARRSEKKGKGKAKEEGWGIPPWMAAKLQTPPIPGVGVDRAPPLPQRPAPHDQSIPGMRGFPFSGAGPRPPRFGCTVPATVPCGPPGIGAMHAGWPFSRSAPYAPGNISAPELGPGGFPTSISHSASEIHAQAQNMDKDAEVKEAQAIELRTTATGHDVSEKEKLKLKDEATALEEQAEECRREAERLRAEGLLLDLELARELDENDGTR
ncbi:hypothetical protein B0O99DRAFT_636891 [Bisporella sp. PMI_857]|nr:hypothetical protein B0O99DRAFT_636891 [Bisporella sp. PMI_857]